MARKRSRTGLRRRQVAWSDASPADASASARDAGDDLEIRRRNRRRLILVLLAAVFLAASAAALFGEYGYLDLRRSQRELEARQRELRDEVERVRRLRLEVETLRTDPSRLERVAREELGYVREGEVTFLLPRFEGDLGDRFDAARPAPDPEDPAAEDRR